VNTRRTSSGPSQRGRANTLAALGGILGLVIAACFSGDPTDSTGPLPADCRTLAIAAGVDPDDAGIQVVGIQNFAFVPSIVSVPEGTEVVWVNCEPSGTPGSSHTSTSDDDLWSSPLLSRGEIYRRDFEDAGSYDYHCIPHPFMEGTVVITAP
jgi:plastocyanin